MTPSTIAPPGCAATGSSPVPSPARSTASCTSRPPAASCSPPPPSIALVWANSPWSASYRDLWATELTLDLGGHAITEDLRHWINDGLMTLFFFVIGLEIKQELTNGQLTTPRDAAVPAAGALGGMVVPALLFLAFNLGGDGRRRLGHPDGHRRRLRPRGPCAARQPGARAS